MYRHPFGQFFDFVRVDGKSYYFDEYKELPKDERLALREEAVKRCTDANQAHSQMRLKLQEPIDKEYRRKLVEMRRQPRFQKRYRGRAAEMRREERSLRDERDRKAREVWSQLTPIDGTTYPAAVHDVFFVWEQEVESTWEKYERLVTHFDWYYSYSDDHSVWTAGERRRREMGALRKQLESEGLGEEAAVLYNKHCPWLNEDGSQKKM